MRALVSGRFVVALLVVGLVGAGLVPAPAGAEQVGEAVPSVTGETSPQANPAAETPGQEMKSGLDSNEGAMPPARATGTGLSAVMAVTLIIWIGLFLYVMRLDRRVRDLEER